MKPVGLVREEALGAAPFQKAETRTRSTPSWLKIAICLLTAMFSHWMRMLFSGASSVTSGTRITIGKDSTQSSSFSERYARNL